MDCRYGEEMMVRRRQSGLEDFVEGAAKLPWWAGVTLALISYVLLSLYANRPLPSPQPGGGLVANATPALLRGMASMGQYVLPVVFLLGAGISAYRAHQRRQLYGQGRGEQGMSLIDGMTWREFEMLVGEGFRQRGFSVAETGGGGADGGIDLVLTKRRERFLVQCKQWRARRVGVAVIRELFGVMAAKGATGGFVVTSGTFTSDAQDFAAGRNIELVDGVGLSVMLKRGRSAAPVVAGDEAASRTSVSENAPPLCPRCNTSMVRRVAKRGASAGEAFWGCTKYPACRGTRPVSA
ncbi:MAG: restriction endonuclease [Deferrisomatales bacterium]|nr:restriction endonuclease [Deferrisomatales bacterium]